MTPSVPTRRSSYLKLERAMAARVLRLPAAAVSHANVMIALYDLTGVKQSERMRADFVANVSHELRTPLTSLIGFIETLRWPARADAEDRMSTRLNSSHS